MTQKIPHSIAFFIIYFVLNAHGTAYAKFEAHAEPPHVEQAIKNFLENPFFIKKIEAIARNAVQPSTLSVGLERVTTLFTSLSGLSHVALGFGTCGLLWYSYKKFVTDPQMERCETKIDNLREKIEGLEKNLDQKLDDIHKDIRELKEKVIKNHKELLEAGQQYADENRQLHKETRNKLDGISGFIDQLKQPTKKKLALEAPAQRVERGFSSNRFSYSNTNVLHDYIQTYKPQRK